MDRKRKIEDDCNNSESENENSPSKRRRHTVDFKLKLVKEAKMYNLSEISRKYKVTRSCIREWTKDEKKLSEIIKAQGTRSTSKINGTRTYITKFRLGGGGRKVWTLKWKTYCLNGL